MSVCRDMALPCPRTIQGSQLLALLAILLATSLLMVTPARAQGDVFIMDETGALDAALIHHNAQPLLNRGASVAVYIKEADEDILPALRKDGLAEEAVLRDDLIVVYVALRPRVTTVLSGRDWSQKLENRGEYVRETTLYSHLDARDYNRVVNDILLRIEVALQNDEASHDNRIRLMVLGAVGIALLFGIVLQFSGIFK